MVSPLTTSQTTWLARYLKANSTECDLEDPEMVMAPLTRETLYAAMLLMNLSWRKGALNLTEGEKEILEFQREQTRRMFPELLGPKTTDSENIFKRLFPPVPVDQLSESEYSALKNLEDCSTPPSPNQSKTSESDK